MDPITIDIDVCQADIAVVLEWIERNDCKLVGAKAHGPGGGNPNLLVEGSILNLRALVIDDFYNGDPESWTELSPLPLAPLEELEAVAQNVCNIIQEARSRSGTDLRYAVQSALEQANGLADGLDDIMNILDVAAMSSTPAKASGIPEHDLQDPHA